MGVAGSSGPGTVVGRSGSAGVPGSGSAGGTGASGTTGVLGSLGCGTSWNGLVARRGVSRSPKSTAGGRLGLLDLW
jgi:hypothetical protein